MSMQSRGHATLSSIAAISFKDEGRMNTLFTRPTSSFIFPPSSFLLAVLAAGLFFGRLDTALLEPEEARYADIPRQMLASGDWLVPTYHGQPYLDKPPLLYWQVMSAYRLFGISAETARLVPGCCGVLTVLFASFWARSVAGPRAGFLAGLVLCLSLRYVYLGRMLATDAPLCMCIAASLSTFAHATAKPRLRWSSWILSALAAGLGVLAKGPVALILIGVPVCLSMFRPHVNIRPGLWAWLSYFAIAVLIAAPWYVAVYIREPGFAEYFFWKHNIQRFVEPFDHVKPFWFYLPTFFAGTLPWCLLLVSRDAESLRSGALRSDSPSNHQWLRNAPLRKDSASRLTMPLVAAGWCLLFFSLSGSKRVGYILPAFPPLAVALGIYLDRLLAAGEQGVPRLARWILPVTMCMLPLGSAGLAAFGYWGWEWVALVSIAMVALGVILYRQARPFTTQLAVAAGLMMLAEIAGIGWFLPAYAERFSLREAIKSTEGEAVFCVGRRWDSIEFYRNGEEIPLLSNSEELQEFLRTHPSAVGFLREGKATDEMLSRMEGVRFVPKYHRVGAVVGVLQRVD